MKFLVLDDSRVMRQLVKHNLKLMGHEDVIEAEDVKGALTAVLQGEPPEMCLVDLNMSGDSPYDGIAFVRALRAKNRTSLVILLTAEQEKAKITEALKAGIDGYLKKPFQSDMFQKTINSVFERGRLSLPQ